MIGTARFFVVSAGIVAAAVLLWVSTRPDETGVAGYVGTVALLACAGAALGLAITLAATLSTAVGRSLRGALAGAVLLIAPIAVVGLWVLVANAPSGRVANEVRGWSDSIGVLTVVDDLEQATPTVAFAVGVLLASLLALIAADRRRAAAAEPRVERYEPIERYPAADDVAASGDTLVPEATTSVHDATDVDAEGGARR